MCGISGIISRHENIDREKFTLMNDTLSHRGPDEGRVWISDDLKKALGFRRLAIVDTGKSASQPISNEDGSILLVCNGEIYNYIELKEILVKNGHVFQSTSDAEVIVHGYESWGTDIFSMLNGMYSIALCDLKKHETLLVRDRFGIKPLYYQISPGKILFASELRSLQHESAQTLNFRSIINFLIYRYIPGEDTIFDHTYKLLPGHILRIADDLGTLTEKYWEARFEDNIQDPRDFSREIRSLLLDSVTRQLRSAVPMAGFLSGGYDSGLMVYLAREAAYNLPCYTAGFKYWEGSEDAYAREAASALGLQLHTKMLDSDSFLSDALIRAWDEPIADISIIPSFHLSQLVAQSHKAALSGDGADEVFGGYNWYYDLAHQLKEQKTSIFRRNRSHRKAFDTYVRYSAMGLFDRAALKGILNPRLHEDIPVDVFWYYNRHFRDDLHPVRTLQWLDLHTFLPGLILPKMDRASMAHSLEVRVPYLDHRIIEKTWSTDLSVYFNENQYKHIFRGMLQGVFPETILNRPKQGFVGPDSYYQDFNFYHALLKNSRLSEMDIVLPEAVEKLLQGRDHWRLWKIAVLELWLRNHFS